MTEVKKMTIRISVDELFAVIQDAARDQYGDKRVVVCIKCDPDGLLVDVEIPVAPTRNQ